MTGFDGGMTHSVTGYDGGMTYSVTGFNGGMTYSVTGFDGGMTGAVLTEPSMYAWMSSKLRPETTHTSN